MATSAVPVKLRAGLSAIRSSRSRLQVALIVLAAALSGIGGMSIPPMLSSRVIPESPAPAVIATGSREETRLTAAAPTVAHDAAPPDGVATPEAAPTQAAAVESPV